MSLDGIVINNFIHIKRVFKNAGDEVIVNNRQNASIIITISGKNLYRQDNITLTSDKFHPIFIPQGASFTYLCKESGVILLFSFQATAFTKTICELSCLPVSRFEECYMKLNKLEQIKPNGYHLAELAELYYLLYQSLHKAVDSDSAYETLAPVLKIMDNNFTDLSLTCDKLAANIHISTVYFRRLFKKSIGVTPAEYLKRLRMEKAESLLEEHIPVNRVAAEVGYSDIYQFSRAYKAYFGHPPSIRNYNTGI